MTRCKKHPKYKALRAPRAVCADCWKVYNKKHGKAADFRDPTMNELGTEADALAQWAASQVPKQDRGGEDDPRTVVKQAIARQIKRIAAANRPPPKKSRSR